jgi:hypothetical protein
MSDDEFNELVKRKFSEFERTKGRVPTLQDLADTLNIDSRMLARKLEKALIALGTENLTEGTSAFKSTLRELLSKSMIFRGWPGLMELCVLLQDCRTSGRGGSQMRWSTKSGEYVLLVRGLPSHVEWVLFQGRKALFTFETENVSDVFLQIEALRKRESPEEPQTEGATPDNVVPFRKPLKE